MKLEALLKLAGWTDADLDSIKPMLENQRFRESMEAQYGAIATERDQFKQRDAEWQKRLDDDYNPRMTAAEKEAQNARIEAATLREQLKIAKDYGYLTPEALKQAETEAAAAQAKADAASNGYDPKNHPTWQDVNKLADAEGEAIALANDLAAEYAFLNGGRSLFEYETVVNGQSLRGMRALRAEAKAQRKNLDTFVAEKFDFAGKRTAMAQAKQKEHDDAITKAAEERVRAEMAQQYGNPMLRSAVPSMKPFIPAMPSGGTVKQPWEVPAQQRKADRIHRLIDIQTKTA